MKIKATIVFDKIWSAINAKTEKGERKYKYIILKGSSRSSKTRSTIDVFDIYARSNKNKRLTAWRDTKTDCKRTVLHDMLKAHKTTNRFKIGYEFNKTESIFNYSTGSTVEIHGTDDEETVHGLEQNVAWLNEPYKISDNTFDQIDQRTSDFIIIDYNPKKDFWVDDVIKDERAIVIHSTFLDNPFCPVEQKRKILSYQSLKYCEVVNKGLLSEVNAYTYNSVTNELNFTHKQLKELNRCVINHKKNSANSYKWSVYGLGEKGERPNRIFKWEKISYHEYMQIDKPVYYGIDWGVVDPMGILEAKYYDGALYLNELSYMSENKLRDKLTPIEKNQIINEIDEGFIIWYLTKLGINKERPVICDNNRPLKIVALRKSGYDYAVATKKWKGSIIDGIDLLNNLKVYYTSNSIYIEKEQENYSRKTDRTGAVLEEPEDTDNHLIDPARYIALFLQEYNIIKTM